MIKIRPFRPGDEVAVIKLWESCNLIVPWNDPLKDIRRKQKIQKEMFLVGCKEERIISTVMAGYDGHRGWIYYLAVDPEYRNQLIGKQMVRNVENLLEKYDCPKINLQVRTENREVIEFYKKLGFVEDNVISLGKRLTEDSPTDN